MTRCIVQNVFSLRTAERSLQSLLEHKDFKADALTLIRLILNLAEIRVDDSRAGHHLSDLQHFMRGFMVKLRANPEGLVQLRQLHEDLKCLASNDGLQCTWNRTARLRPICGDLYLKHYEEPAPPTVCEPASARRRSRRPPGVSASN